MRPDPSLNVPPAPGQTALGKFAEPHAWVIRGLVEYGWPDLTPFAGRIPAGRPGGMELGRFRDSGGREGVHLLMTAAAGGYAVPDDGVYDFAVRCYRRDGGWMVGVRCAEANFIQEFSFDPQNPLYVAGYVHQAVTTYVNQFVGWRLQGGELTWAQRQGLPELEGEACSPALTRFIDELVRSRRGLDTGPAQGWWLGLDSAPPPSSSGDAKKGPAAGQIVAGGGPIAVAGRVAGGSTSPVAQGQEQAARAGRALTATSAMMLLVGLVSVLNAVLTLVLFQLDRVTALAGSGCFGLALTVGGIVGILGGRRLGEIKNSFLPWLAIAANLVLPPLVLVALFNIDVACCSAAAPVILCVPTALYALKVWVDPHVAKTRKELG